MAVFRRGSTTACGPIVAGVSGDAAASARRRTARGRPGGPAEPVLLGTYTVLERRARARGGASHPSWPTSSRSTCPDRVQTRTGLVFSDVGWRSCSGCSLGEPAHARGRTWREPELGADGARSSRSSPTWRCPTPTRTVVAMLDRSIWLPSSVAIHPPLNASVRDEDAARGLSSRRIVACRVRTPWARWSTYHAFRL